MEIQEIKSYLKQKKITYQQLSDTSNIPLNTLKNIFRGKTANPRIDTMQAIERALGLDKAQEYFFDVSGLSENEQKIVANISQLTDEETKELSSFIDYLISKRK